MAKKSACATATFAWSRVATVAKFIVAAGLLLPAILINADLSGPQSWEWKTAAVGSIIAGALFAEVSVLLVFERRWVLSLLSLVTAVFFVTCNLQTAMDSASTHSDLRSDGRNASIIAAETRRSQRSQWSQTVAAQKNIAGDEAVGAIESEIQARIAANATRWRDTDACNPAEITAGPSKTFCSEVSTLKAKKAAAELRDETQAKIDESLEIDASRTEVVTSADPYAGNVAAFLSVFGATFDDEGKKAITASRNATKSLGLELMATFGPAGVLLLFDLWGRRHRPVIEPLPRTSATVAPPPRNKALAPPPVNVALAVPPLPIAPENPIHGFISAELERCPGTNIKAGDAWRMWQTYAAKHSLSAGSQRVFGETFGKFFVRDANNNRPRYLNVRAKQKALVMGPRLAVSNAG